MTMRNREEKTMGEMGSVLLGIEEAQRIVLADVVPLPTETVFLLQALGRIIAEEIRAPWDVPMEDSSAMDGYAFSSGDLREGRLDVVGFLPAGENRTVPVAPGAAVKIMTGAPVPPGCDTVIPIENVEVDGDGIRLLRPAVPGDHVRKRGEDLRKGERVIPSGAYLRPQEIGMLASLGRVSVEVFRKARVTILATGDELVEIGSGPASGKILNSNSYGIACQVAETGGEAIVAGIAKDDPGSLMEKMSEGLRTDVLVTTGGVSVGDRDYVKEAIVGLGGEIRFWKVRMKPGKPVVFAIIRGKPVFALPGNPVAAMVAYEQFVRPALLRMMGHTRIFRPVVKATLKDGARNKGDRPHLVRVLVSLKEGRYEASTTGSQSSARLASMTGGNGLLTLAPGVSLLAGDEAPVRLLDRSFEMGEFRDGAG
ncbi:MAG: molybdopterin molybdotransferase MoeA [Desulfobacteria bacterium]